MKGGGEKAGDVIAVPRLTQMMDEKCLCGCVLVCSTSVSCGNVLKLIMNSIKRLYCRLDSEILEEILKMKTSVGDVSTLTPQDGSLKKTKTKTKTENQQKSQPSWRINKWN